MGICLSKEKDVSYMLKACFVAVIVVLFLFFMMRRVGGHLSCCDNHFSALDSILSENQVSEEM